METLSDLRSALKRILAHFAVAPVIRLGTGSKPNPKPLNGTREYPWYSERLHESATENCSTQSESRTELSHLGSVSKQQFPDDQYADR
jgi:hypothetical protein